VTADAKDETPETEAARVSAGAAVDAAALVASTDVEAALTAALARVSADMLAASRKNQINALWERMQAVIAGLLTLATIVAAFRDPEHIPLVLTNALFVVLGFYFGRTNHARPTPTHPYGDAQ
jgi:hypothetical protein